MHSRALTIHAVADDATYIEVESQENMVPVAIAASAATWTPATFTLQLPNPDNGMPGTTSVFQATDDGAVTLTDAKWTTIPEAMARKCAAVSKFRILFNVAESAGPISAYIAWAPLGGA